VDLRVQGERVPLPPGIDLAAYRIIQEALTNTRKHARATHAEVRLGFSDHRLELTVTDDGTATANGSRGGFGLVGMRERVSLYGGTLQAGPRPGGGFLVQATLPVRENGQAR
jgi:signal transduction histidine kinase